MSVIIAASSRIAAEAGKAVAQQGGNAVDAALAATITSMNTELGVMAPGAGGFIAIWPRKGEPVAIDAYAEMPGRGLKDRQSCRPPKTISFSYGGWMETRIGYSSVAIPGIWAGLEKASQQYGILPWSELVAPACYYLEQGFPLSSGAAEYLQYTHQAIFSWHPDSKKTIHHADGTPLQAGEKVRLPQLAKSLNQIAQEGASCFYTGEIARKIAEEIQSQRGWLTATDLAEYRPLERVPLRCHFGGWEVVTNPPPAIGGACLTAMLLLLDRQPRPTGEASANRRMAEVQRAVLDYRHQHLDGVSSQEMEEKIENLLVLAHSGGKLGGENSPSTIHTSAVDTEGLACAISASAGYGSGVMIGGTGLWLNNSLGEIELHPQGGQGILPGTRLVSNMAPTIARQDDGTVIALGSPGASRITTAIAQVLFQLIHRGMSVREGIAYPRLHVERFQGRLTVALEPGIGRELGKEWEKRQFPSPSMYFGGVQVAGWSPKQGLMGGADFRREGGTATSF